MCKAFWQQVDMENEDSNYMKIVEGLMFDL